MFQNKKYKKFNLKRKIGAKALQSTRRFHLWMSIIYYTGIINARCYIISNKCDIIMKKLNKLKILHSSLIVIDIFKKKLIS